MLSMLLCLSCVYVGMTAVFADDAEYTPVVGLAPEMYSPKTVYVDDDFNNRDTTNENTDLTKIAEGQTEYPHQVVVKNAAGTSNITSFVLGSDGTDVYAAPTAAWQNLVVKGINDINADRIAISFKFKLGISGKSFQIWANRASDTYERLFSIQLLQSGAKCEVRYNDGTLNEKGSPSMPLMYNNFTTQGLNTWNRLYFELEKTPAESNTFTVRIKKVYFIDSKGIPTSLSESMLNELTDVDVDWWSAGCDASTASKTAFVIRQNATDQLCIDDVMLYVPDDLKMKGASYDSAAGKVKAVFTRGLNADTLSGITIKSGENVIAATAALDPTDTSNRTVLVTPAAALDVENESYVVTASGVTDLEGNAVPGKSVIIGKLSLIVENEKYYVNDAEVTTTKLNASPGQTVAAKADVTNPTDANAEIMPIIAYYEGDILKCVNVADTVTVTAGGSNQISASITMPETLGENGKLRFFAFKDNKMMPIMSSLDKDNK